VSFSCSGWTRDPLFDAVKIDGLDIELVGGVIGFAAGDVWVPIATYNKGRVAHWDGTNWNQEDLDPLNPPTEVDAIWGTSANDLWVAARNFSGYLYHRANGAWTADPNAPPAKKFFSIWGSDSNNLFLTGTDSSWSGNVWRKSGGSWVAQSLPGSVDWTKASMGQVWGLDSSHVYVTAALDLDSDGNDDQGVFLFFDGSTWTNILVPVDVVELSSVHGTSSDDLYVSGTLNDGSGVLYHVTDGLMTWSEAVVNPGIAGYGPVWSKYAGTVLASGYQPPAIAGSLRVTTDAPMNGTDTESVDDKAYNPVGFWPGVDGVTVHLVHIATAGVVAGFYSGICN